MTDKQALKRARKMYGLRARTYSNKFICEVGTIERGPMPLYIITGRGKTWEEAFADAESK